MGRCADVLKISRGVTISKSSPTQLKMSHLLWLYHPDQTLTEASTKVRIEVFITASDYTC